MTLRFGTDGVRGLANAELTPELVVALGRAAARVLGCDRFVVGRDTRRSGPLLEAALAAGLASEGVRVDLLGMAPTPAVASASAWDGVCGAVISASHNPFPDNGIKFFLPGGRKLTDDIEARLEAELDRIVHGGAGRPDAPTAERVGTITDAHGLLDRYGDSIVASVDGHRLDGLALVIDCANGAAAEAAPAALRRLGADVTVINDRPDGTNINDRCGSTDPSDLRRAVVELGADAGLAFDGDADRVIAVDATGQLVDGDQIIAVCALDLKQRGQLVDDTVVITVMTNLGFRLAMAERGVHLVETAVGDRYVLDALEDGGWSLGGEQSGHVIFRRLATTGDGLLTGVQLLDVVARRGMPLGDLAGVMRRLPQVLRNVKVSGSAVDLTDRMAGDVAEAETELGATGRVLVRPSGTEPLVRVMVEASSQDQADAVAARLVSSVERLASDAGEPARSGRSRPA
ncbi:MAG: phosphoglucosamine mutase [Acidimicrobiales bacterium]